MIGRHTSQTMLFPLVWAASACLAVQLASGWGGEHNRITAAAIEVLSSEEKAAIASEAAAMSHFYCEFPDRNWPCFGQWGGGNADPREPRMPDFRREWDVSFYCGWDPVLRKGKSYVHAPPYSIEAAVSFFEKSLKSFQRGELADGARFCGVMFHYIQDSGAFPHIQPLHRVFHTKSMEPINVSGYTPQQMGSTGSEAAASLRERVTKLVDTTEHRLAPLLEQMGMPLNEAKELCKKELMPEAVSKAVTRLRQQKPAEYDAATVDCANECTRVCADVLHTLLTLATPSKHPPMRQTQLNANLVFNSSFEEDAGDTVPDGWCVGWLNPADRAGHAEWYRSGTHWDKPVRTGARSLLILWTPKEGLEWRQTWRHANTVSSEETYRGSVWVKPRAATGATWLGLEFYDIDYRPIKTAKSDAALRENEWQKLTVESAVPEKAHRMRVILHAEAANGAVWFDDVEVKRLNP